MVTGVFPFPGIAVPAIAGAGGYRGGVGNTATMAAQAGDGPGGGKAATAGVNDMGGGGAGYAAPGSAGSGGVAGGVAYGNDFLLPLIGGSGGAGGRSVARASAAGGGLGERAPESRIRLNQKNLF